MSTEIMKGQPMTVQSVLNQVKLIQELMENVMKKDEHFGVVPGCGNKPTLLKAGAEKICFTFRLAPKFEVFEREYENGHREYRVTTTLFSIESGNLVGSGVGVASTNETKWKYRNDIEDTGEPIPKDYKLNKGKYKEEGFIAVKDDATDQWTWCTIKKIEHTNPADYYNTVLKMAKKRSQVDAVLTATACSDIFAQDLEEIGDQLKKVVKDEPQKEPIKETVVQGHKDKQEPDKKKEKPDKQEKKSLEFNGVLDDVKPIHGVNNKTKKPFTRYGLLFKDGTTFGTFDADIADIAVSLIDAEVNITYEVNGKYNNVVTISPIIK